MGLAVEPHVFAHPLGGTGIGTEEAEPVSEWQNRLLLQAADLGIRLVMPLQL